MARRVERSNVNGANLERRFVFGCSVDMSTIAATNDWQLVRFQLKVMLVS